MGQTGLVARPVFLYDGDCAFCSTCARFIERRMRTGAQVVPWQFTDIAALGVSQEATPKQAVQWIDAHGVSGRSGRDCRAAARCRLLLATARRGARYPSGAVGSRGRLYRWVARNRHRLPGGTASCSLPQAQRDRLKAQQVVPPA